jgi:hypothetical protein
VLLLVALIASVAAWRINRAPSFLHEGSRSRWIKAAVAHEDLRARRHSPVRTTFRKLFETSAAQASSRATLFVRGEARLELDGRAIELERGPGSELSARLECAPGTHTLSCAVQRSDGPPLLRFEAADLGLFSDESWVCDPQAGGGAVELCSAPLLPDVTRTAPTVPEVIRQQLVVLLATLCALAAAIHFLRPAAARHLERLPGALRWVLLFAVAALALHDLFALPPGLGMDAEGHVEYVRLIVERGRLPLPRDGWQCHQAPLFHLLSVPFYRLASDPVAQSAQIWMRVIPVLCCTLQVEVLYRIGKRAFARDPLLQLLVLWIGSLFPMQLAMGQFASNEPLLGLLGSLIVWRCVGWIVDRPRPLRLRDAAGAGFLVGAAALVKATGLLFVPIVGLTLVLCQRGLTPRAILARCAVFLAALSLIAGWWYVWIWSQTGHPIVLPWDFDVISLPWWQAPGYRTAAEFTHFGRALVQPFLAATAGFWDGLYSGAWMDGALSGRLAPPPWHYAPMYACAWLAVPLTLAGFLGVLRSQSGTERWLQRFATCACTLFGFSILESYLHLANYASGKPTYALGLLACFALLIALGLRPFLARPVAGAWLGAWIVLFGGCSYVSFWSV